MVSGVRRDFWFVEVTLYVQAGQIIPPLGPFVQIWGDHTHEKVAVKQRFLVIR